MGRPKHPKKELERVLREAEAKDWRIEKRPNGYFKMKCPCEQMHIKTVRISPSNPYYENQLRAQLLPATCWEE
ncbi:ABC transporter ATP-binding protein [Mycobacterium eburneum]|nr:ABC transporter ATP-binding protein [Mycobacterium eburneum]TDH54158.1 ABC transporter ATP-binding protein [Mycobacterium eburneum]